MNDIQYIIHRLAVVALDHDGRATDTLAVADGRQPHPSRRHVPPLHNGSTMIIATFADEDDPETGEAGFLPVRRKPRITVRNPPSVINNLLADCADSSTPVAIQGWMQTSEMASNTPPIWATVLLPLVDGLAFDLEDWPSSYLQLVVVSGRVGENTGLSLPYANETTGDDQYGPALLRTSITAVPPPEPTTDGEHDRLLVAAATLPPPDGELELADGARVTWSLSVGEDGPATG